MKRYNGPGQLYVNTSEGLKPLGKIQEVEITEEPPELDIRGDNPARIVAQPSEFSASITFTDEASEALRNITALAEAAAKVFEQLWETVKKMIETCPNRRVVHLAAYGRPRARKKNQKRLVRYYKKLKKLKGD